MKLLQLLCLVKLRHCQHFASSLQRNRRPPHHHQQQRTASNAKNYESFLMKLLTHFLSLVCLESNWMCNMKRAFDVSLYSVLFFFCMIFISFILSIWCVACLEGSKREPEIASAWPAYELAKAGKWLKFGSVLLGLYRMSKFACAGILSKFSHEH